MSQYLSGRQKGFVALQGSVGVVVIGVVVVPAVGFDDDKVCGVGLERSLTKIGVGLERSSEVIDEVNVCPNVCDAVEKV